MSSYSNVEWLDMVRFYAIAGDNLAEARRLYARPDHLNSLRRRGIRNPRVPTPTTILSATQRLLTYGQFRMPTHAQARGRPQQHSPQLEEDILSYFYEDPRRSTREAGRRFGVSHYFVWRLLHQVGMHPFHFRRTQALYDSDPQSRISLCQWILEHQNINILWTDESTFTRVGLFNIHNEHYWDFNNPHVVVEHSHQVRFSVNVWAGIINNTIIGPIFIDGHLNGRNYLNLIRETVPELLMDVPLAYTRDMYFQHDGCPAHYERNVRAYLNEEFGEKWIGRGGPVTWPPRSPDLTPLDFFLWSEIKRIVYRKEARSAEHLKRKIVRAFDKVKRDTNTLRSLKENLFKRARLCIEVNGQQFEQLLPYR